MVNSCIGYSIKNSVIRPFRRKNYELSLVTYTFMLLWKPWLKWLRML